MRLHSFPTASIGQYRQRSPGLYCYSDVSTRASRRDSKSQVMFSAVDCLSGGVVEHNYKEKWGEGIALKNTSSDVKLISLTIRGHTFARAGSSVH